MTTNEQTITEKIIYTCTLNPSNHDTIVSATWGITPTGPTIGTPTTGSTTSAAMISNLTAPIVYVVNVHIVGASGQQYDGYLEINAVVTHSG